MKQVITILSLFCIALFLLSQVAYANAPGPALGSNDGEDSVATIMIIAFVVICLGLTCFTCWMEWLIAGPFGFRRDYQKSILITNLITQLTMHLLEFLLIYFGSYGIEYRIQQYLLIILVLEVLVYVSECMIYCRIMREVSTKRILLYTACANTASLLGGLLVTTIIL